MLSLFGAFIVGMGVMGLVVFLVATRDHRPSYPTVEDRFTPPPSFEEYQPRSTEEEAVPPKGGTGVQPRGGTASKGLQ